MVSVTRGKNQPLLPQVKYNKYHLSEIVLKNHIIGIILWKSAMKCVFYKHVPIGNIGNRGSQFRTTVEPNLNSYCRKIIILGGIFADIFVRDNIVSSL